MVHQHFRLVPPFTVAENVILGEHREEARRFFLQPRHDRARVAALGERYGMAINPRARIWQLSVGEQQRVEILKALYREAQILILDEPTAVLTPQESEALFVTLRTMADEGRTVIFISHKLHEVKAVSDRVTVLRGGRTVATLATADASPRELAALMVGREVELAKRVERATPPREDAALEVDGPVACAATAARRRCATCRCPCATARSSASPASPGTASASSPRRSPGCGRRAAGRRARRRAQAADRRSARGDRRRRRARSRGSARHRRRAEPEHRREHGAQVVPRARRLARPDPALAGDPRARARPDRALRRRHAGVAHRARATSPAATCRSSSSAASSRASRRC